MDIMISLTAYTRHRLTCNTNTKAVFILIFMILSVFSCTNKNTAVNLTSSQKASIILASSAVVYNLSEVSQGVVKFTAFIKNKDTTTITIAHPSIWFPSGYKPGSIKHFDDSHGKSEILLKIIKPDGTNIVLRDGTLHGFDPNNVHFLIIPSGETRTFDIGWFFQNARGRWGNNYEAEKIFLSKGKYKIKILFRNFFPKAAFYDEHTKENKFVNVWTGEMESEHITIEIK